MAQTLWSAPAHRQSLIWRRNCPSHFGRMLRSRRCAVYYPWYQGVCERSLRAGLSCDDHALRLCQVACYSSHWSAQAAVEGHKADPEKVHVLPFGANLEQETEPAALRPQAARRLEAPWRFLFVGVEWARKGGDLAVAIVRSLNRKRVPGGTRGGGLPTSGLRLSVTRLCAGGRIRQSAHSGMGAANWRIYLRHPFFTSCHRSPRHTGLFSAKPAHMGCPGLSTVTGGIPTIVGKWSQRPTFCPGCPGGRLRGVYPCPLQPRHLFAAFPEFAAPLPRTPELGREPASFLRAARSRRDLECLASRPFRPRLTFPHEPRRDPLQGSAPPAAQPFDSHVLRQFVDLACGRQSVARCSRFHSRWPC